MSKPRYDWWTYVKGMIRRYPMLKEELRELHAQSTVAQYADMPRGGGNGRAMECLAIRELPSNKQREYEAVRRAIAVTERYRNGRERLHVIDAVLWTRSHTIAGAALTVPCHYKTAQGWHNQFVRQVAACYGLLDE